MRLRDSPKATQLGSGNLSSDPTPRPLPRELHGVNCLTSHPGSSLLARGREARVHLLLLCCVVFTQTSTSLSRICRVPSTEGTSKGSCALHLPRPLWTRERTQVLYIQGRVYMGATKSQWPSRLRASSCQRCGLCRKAEAPLAPLRPSVPPHPSASCSAPHTGSWSCHSGDCQPCNSQHPLITSLGVSIGLTTHLQPQTAQAGCCQRLENGRLADPYTGSETSGVFA